MIEKEAKSKKPMIGLIWQPKVPSLPSDKAPTLLQTSAVYNPKPDLIDALFVPPTTNPRNMNKFLKKQVKDTAGKNWFHMPAPTVTPELKKDLQLLKLRSVIDPKRHYKKSDSKSNVIPKYFQVGTMIESASDFFTGRLTRKKRKATLADELLSDHTLGECRKRKVREIEKRNRPGGVEKWKRKGGQPWKRAKQTRH